MISLIYTAYFIGFLMYLASSIYLLAGERTCKQVFWAAFVSWASLAVFITLCVISEFLRIS